MLIAPGVYLVFALLGTLLGGVVGLIAAHFVRSRPGVCLATWWAAVSRPIRRSRRFTSKTTAISTPPPGVFATMLALAGRRTGAGIGRGHRPRHSAGCAVRRILRPGVPHGAPRRTDLHLLDRPKRQERTRRPRPEDIPGRGARRFWHIRVGRILAPKTHIGSDTAPGKALRKNNLARAKQSITEFLTVCEWPECRVQEGEPSTSFAFAVSVTVPDVKLHAAVFLFRILCFLRFLLFV